jgi:RNA polymerase sigma-70 factor
MKERNADRQGFDRLVSEAFRRARDSHGDLGLPLEEFRARILAIATRNLRADAAWWSIVDFTAKLNLEDLYLATACSARSDPAWARFLELYRKTLRDMHQFISPGAENPADLADHTVNDMFLPDRSGQSRIASYDGRSSLVTWLRVIVTNRAINERQLAYNRVRRVEPDHDIPDSAGLESLETGIQAGRYGKALSDSIQSACGELGNQDRLIILWRYEEGMQLGQIAKLLGVHQSTVTRQIERMLRRVRADVVSILAARYGLSEAAIDECLASVADPGHAIPVLGFLKPDRRERRPSRVM